MEISDCFGDDPCDFDDLGHAQLCFEDIYVSIYKLDGQEWAQKLRLRLVPRQPRRSTDISAAALFVQREVEEEEARTLFGAARSYFGW